MCSIFFDFVVYGRWEAVHSLKMLSQGVGTFSNIENFIMRTLFFCFFGTLSRPSRHVGPRLTCWMSSRSGRARPAGKVRKGVQKGPKIKALRMKFSILENVPTPQESIFRLWAMYGLPMPRYGKIQKISERIK